MSENGNNEQLPSRRPFTYKTLDTKDKNIFEVYKKTDEVLFSSKLEKKKKRFIK